MPSPACRALESGPFDQSTESRAGWPRPGGRGLALALLALLAGPPAADAAGLPLGAPTLRERRVGRTVAPGVVWTRIVRFPASTRPRNSGRWVVNVLAIDRRRLQGRLSAVLSNDRVAEQETTSSMARRVRAVAGVNGGFWSGHRGVRGGDSVGALVIGGELISEPVDGRSALLIPRSPAARPAVAALGFRGSVEIEGRKRHLDGINRLRGEVPNCGGRGGDYPTEHPQHNLICTDASELVLLYPRFGPRTFTDRNGVESVIQGGAVTATRDAGNSFIPRNGYVLSGDGDAGEFLRAAAQPGRQPRVTTELLEGSVPLNWASYETVLSGGPRLLTAGRMTVRAAAEGFAPRGNPGLFRGFVASRNPRTLAGVTADGRVLLVTVDGRRFGVSVGVTLYEAARLMRALGARDALNLDGGGSTTMTVGGRVVNSPSDLGGERMVSDGLFVLP